MTLNQNAISIRSTGDNYFHLYGKPLYFSFVKPLTVDRCECNRKQLNMCGCSYYYILVTERD
ncbi:MAG TPA: hypothetical protein DCM34_05500 [Salmonella bongori]|nr:hypothetical protein [Salmonella bongori]ECC9752931.1 hypothetical protein [Salmonella bongori]ECE6547866.1 hypothetical protein [Salmonella bongori]ECI3519797.1 hypothetical protein [Salmonella bongori]HAD92631.1 hypothetical protein [Salmonella bongori]